MTVSTIVTSLVAFITPFLPYLIKGGEKAAEEAGAKFGAAAWERARSVWAKLQPKVEARPSAQEAAKDLAASPDDEDSRAALRAQIKKILVEDPSLIDELAAQLKEAQDAGVIVTVSGDRSVGIGGNVSGSTIITGDNSRAE